MLAEPSERVSGRSRALEERGSRSELVRVGSHRCVRVPRRTPSKDLEHERFETPLLILARLNAERADGSEPALERLGVTGASYDLEALLPELLP